ncbi:MAG: hypothetical protein HYW49_13725 [Deltaproteobacteria bacterium]|nr:hypothetical protein [Deltaproteobacteria bacterium]
MPSESGLLSLLHVEALRLRLNTPEENGAPEKEVGNKPEALTGIGIRSETRSIAELYSDAWPTGVSAADLRGALHRNLRKVFDALLKDVKNARDRMLALNAGRRAMVERRLEFIARRIAHARGERFQRQLTLTEVLRDAGIAADREPATLAGAAWAAFQGEVALYNVFELFFLKSLEFHAWRPFEDADLRRMNFAAHSFLNHRAVDFAHDKHCWNFVRNNVYSWYVPSQEVADAISAVLREIARKTPLSWSDADLLNWTAELAGGLSHLRFREDRAHAENIVAFVEKHLGIPLVSEFHGRCVCSKVLLPALERGGIALAILDRLLSSLSGTISLHEEEMNPESKQLQNALWACESEGLELFWTEVMSLLKTLSSVSADKAIAPVYPHLVTDSAPLYRVPHVLRGVQMLALELHNLDQMPLSGPELSALHHGSAGQIQQLEMFDLAIVTDSPERAKSANWMAALADQLPYWKSLVGSATNLNWGELHLYLALSKLKENSVCVYLSHRMLPEGRDGDKLRKALLSQAALQELIEVQGGALGTHRYVYVFRRTADKARRDVHRPRFGKTETFNADDLASRLENANCVQSEILERGWSHLFVTGNAPLVRHLEHRFPKLMHVASVQGVPCAAGDGKRSAGQVSFTMANQLTGALHGWPTETGVRFHTHSNNEASWRIFPRNPLDVSWLECLLNSGVTQSWIRHRAQQTPGRHLKINDVRQIPVVDLSHVSSADVHRASELLGTVRPDRTALGDWLAHGDALAMRKAKFMALASRVGSMEKLLDRYRPLFKDGTLDGTSGLPELRPEAITHFYPDRLLCALAKSPDAQIQYRSRELSPLPSDSWTVLSADCVVQPRRSFIVIATRQGPSIQLTVPTGAEKFVASQIMAMAGRTWSETLSLLQIPMDVSLFAAQSSEIVRALNQTAQETDLYRDAIDRLACDLFEMPAELRESF